MESSKVFGGAEECHSSESGWTMYIGSPGDDDDGHSDDGDYDDDGGGGSGSDDTNASPEDDSDDSMASDASSGLSKPYENGQVRHTNIFHFKGEEDDEDDSNSKGSDNKKAKRQLKKEKAEMRRKEGKEEVVFMAKGRGSSSAQSDSKVIRKNVRNMAKRK